MVSEAGDAFEKWAHANASKIHADSLDEAAMGFAAGWDATGARLAASRALVEKLVPALENARDVVHRTHCLPQPLKQCWKECEEAMDAMLEAGWMPTEVKP